MRRLSIVWLAPLALLALFSSPAQAAKRGPDLKVTKLRLLGSPAPGQSFTVQVAVSNAGKKKAGASQTALVLSRDAKVGKGDRGLAKRKANALKPRKRATATLKITIAAGVVPAPYRVIACADAKRKVKETNEKNNCRAAALTVVPPVMGGPGTNPSGGGLPTGGTPKPTPTPSPTPTATPTATPTPTPTPRPTDPFPKPPLPPAPDPASEAPDPPPGSATTVADGTEFLYTGSDPIQKEVAAGTIAPKQVAVLRGKVLDSAGAPVPGARVTVLDHPEFGYTSTRDDGGYDLAVNGGEELVLQFEQKDYTTLQRSESVPWQDFVRLDDVMLTKYAAPLPVEQDATQITAVTSTTSSDKDGDRKATLMFDPGTDATMTLPNGHTQTLDNTMQVAATEYTVGPNGEQRMPGELPDTSAYTYAVEFSVKQATDAGATDVQFDKPVATYVDNFLDFKAGTVVPAAYYDKDKAAWVPSQNGIVLKIVGRTSGRADIDLTGDGVADPAKYAGLGIDDAERGKLAQEYADNTSLWRVQVKHFTPWDYNWPYGCKANCPPPDNDPPPPPYCPECQAAGSIVGVFNQTLGEKIDVTGTPYTLHYDSGRVPGYKSAYSLKIPVTGSSVSGNLLGVQLQVTVGGREFDQGLPPTPNQVVPFTWDGKDAYGRTLDGAQTATIRIGYTYEAVYLEPLEFDAAFAQFGGAPVTKSDGSPGAPARRTVTAWQQYARTIGVLDAGSDALGAWTLDVHHTYDPVGKTLYLGDGTRLTSDALRSEIRTAAGLDPLAFLNGGTPATETDLGLVRGIDVGSDGSIYIAETSKNQVEKVTPDGKIKTIAGGLGATDDGDGGPATKARLVGPSDVAVAQDGTVFISDTGNARARRIAPDGKISTYAGGGDPDTLGDNGPAISASLHSPRGLALTPDGTLYVAEAGRDRVRRITPDGRIATAAGGGNPASGVGDGGSAPDASLDRPTDVAIDSTGSLYIADSQHGRVRKVDPTGRIDTLAGTGGSGSSGDGGPGTDAQIGEPTAVAVGRDGAVYVADRIHHKVSRISTDGTITGFVGTGASGEGGDGGTPQQAELSFPQALAVAPDASLLIGDAGNGRVRRASVALPGFTDAAFSLPSQNGTEVYEFDRTGRHLRTVDALTGSLRYSFGYDGQGRLTSVTDGDGNVTTITRDAGGKATGIVAPGAGGGRTTTLTIGGDGWLASVKNPANEQTGLTYSADGLLQTFTDPMDNTAHFGYDGAGLLASDKDLGGHSTTYARTDVAGGFRVTRTSPAGRITRYETTTDPAGGTHTTVTEPSGAVTETDYGADGVTTITGPDGTVTTAKSGPDARWGMRAPIPAEVTTKTPSGLTRKVTRTQTVSLTAPGDPFAIDVLTDQTTHGGGTDDMTYDGGTRTATVESAGSRTITTTLDASGRPVQRALGGGTDPVALHYNAAGRVTSVSQGTHSLTLGYDPDHPYRVLTSTDGESRTTTLTYDAAERVKTIKLPSGHQYAYGYDADGNRTSVTMPNDRVHQYTYDELGRATGYDPTGSSNFGRAFDADGFATSLTQPGGGGQTLERQASGRLTGVTSPDGTASTFGYANGDASNRLATAHRTGPGGRSDETRFGYDGALVTSKESRDAGGAYASFAYAYDDRLKLESIDLTAGADSDHQAITRDADGFVTGQGPFTFARNGPAGLASKISDDKLSLTLDYSATGTEKKRTTTVASTPVFETDVTRDKSGRITQKVEKVGNGAPVTFTYDYWPDGELKSVSGGSAESYAYDVNGNRTAANGQTASYTDDDRLNGYTYDAAGALSAHSADTYNYGDTGELLSATVNGTTVNYTYDSAGRRVARTEGGQTYRYIYGDPRRPLLVTATRAPDHTLTTYNYGEDDLLFSVKRNGQRFYVATDQVGTPRVVADATGAIVKRVDYDAFGVRSGDTAPSFDLAIGFAGGIDDRVTGLVRFGLRDYDPATGRFTARDPIFQAGGPNVYAYVNNDPIAGRDPLGLDGWFSNAVQAVHDFFSSDKTQTAISQISQIESDGQIVKAAGELSKGIDRVNTTQEILDTALELKEASQEPTDPEQAAGYLKCGLKWLKKVLPLDLVGTDAAAQTLDEGMKHARNQRDTGTINAGEASQLRQIEW